MYWWIQDSALQHIEAQAAAMGPNVISTEMQETFATTMATRDDGTSRLVTTAGETAVISIQGIMTDSPDIFAMIFGGGNVLYSEIVQAVAQVEQDPAVTSVEFDIKSPGGTVAGAYDAVAAIESMTKPTKTIARDVLASAAYLLAAQTDRIEAANEALSVGSIGVARMYGLNPNAVAVTSRNAPNKRPDVTTPEGRAAVEDELDEMHDLMVGVIASGRGTTVEKINADFGKGSTMLAEKAIKQGMIDGIQGQAPKLSIVKPTTTATRGNQSEIKTMDLSKLRAEHPEVYAAAVQDGVAQERDRVVGHLKMGQSSGAVDIAAKAIEEGTGMTVTLQSEYMSAGMNRRDQNDRQGDDADTSAADTAAADQADADASAVLATVENHFGIETAGGAA